MKKKLLLALLVVAILTCLFAITVNAADEVTVIVDGVTDTVDFEEVFNLNNGYVAGFKNSEAYGKHNIQDVIFPETIDGFNNSSKDLFKESTVLKTVTFEGTSVDMNDCSSMFYKSSIESLVFEQGHNCILNVRRYTKSVFADCTSLKTVKFPTFTKNTDGASDMGDALGHMFANCSNMVAQNDIVFGEGVVSLGGQMIFANCSSLSNNAEGKCEVYFPSSIKTINHRSFQGAAITAIHLDGCTALESIGSGTGSEGTLSGTKLTSIDFSDCTSLNYLCSKVMGDNTLLTTVKGFENTKVTSLPTNAFTGCAALTSISFPNGITQIGEKAFYKCSALTGTYTFTNVETISKESFRYAATNQGTNLVLSFPSLVTLGGNSGDTHVFSNSGITELSFGDDVKDMGYNTFTSCSRLWRVEFAGFAEGFTFKSYTFESCSALKAFSIPEGITSLPSRMFKDCSSLTAVYLPSTLTAINSGDNDNATFKKCTSLYFVDEPFTYKTLEEIPAEPEVYYFPTGLTTMTSETFDGSRVNDVVVFPAGLTDLSNGYTFEGSKSASGTPTVVLLGDMTAVAIKSWGVKAVYFCNEADVDATTAGLTGSITAHYCTVDGNHLRSPRDDVSTPATCVDAEISQTFCFCGASMGTQQTAPALGHAKDLEADEMWNYGGNYYVNAVYAYHCTRCLENYDSEEEVENSALFTNLGYSTEIVGEGETAKGNIVTRTQLNNAAMDSYKATLKAEDTVLYGIFAGISAGQANPVNADATANGSVVICKFENAKYTKLELRINGIGSAAFDTNLFCGAYMIVNDDVTYLTNGSYGKEAQTIKFNDFKE